MISYTGMRDVVGNGCILLYLHSVLIGKPNVSAEVVIFSSTFVFCKHVAHICKTNSTRLNNRLLSYRKALLPLVLSLIHGNVLKTTQSHLVSHKCPPILMFYCQYCKTMIWTCQIQVFPSRQACIEKSISYNPREKGCATLMMSSVKRGDRHENIRGTNSPF